MGRRPDPNDQDLLRLVAEGSRVGFTYEMTAKHARLGVSTLYKWLKLGREGDETYTAFVEAIDGNETRGALFLLARIQQAAQGGDWKAAAWLMERRHGYVSSGALALREQESGGEVVDAWDFVRKAIELAPHEVKRLLEAAK